ncbi:hypothetical protein V8F06_000506 [Rhypophila decipiens]
MTSAIDIDPVAPRRRLGFFDLARELRDMVYEHYVTIDGGYILNPETWKLRPNNRTDSGVGVLDPTSIPSAYNLPASNTVVDMSLHLCVQQLEEFMREKFAGQIPQALEETLSHHFPEFMGDQLHALLSGDEDAHLGMWHAPYVGPSTKFSFLELIMQQPELATFFDRFPKAVLDLGLQNQPWKIPPSEEDNKTALQLLAPRMATQSEAGFISPEGPSHIHRFFEHHLDPPNRYLYRFSAAAAAIRFLESLDPSTRAYIRRILLDEDRQSVAHPERHGQGLEHFCRNNPLLRIERRVSMWKALFPQQEHSPPSEYLWSGRQSRWRRAERPLGVRNEDDVPGSESMVHLWDRLALGYFKLYEEIDESFSPYFSKVIAAWIAEALNLHSSITLVIDGNPISRHSSEVFERFVIYDAVWQAALEQCFTSKRVSCPRSWTWVAAGERPKMLDDIYVGPGLGGCVFERFPSMIKKLVDGSFPGVEAMLFEHGDWDYNQWMKARAERFDGTSVQPVPPLATNWVEIFEGDLLPKPEGREPLCHIPLPLRGQVTMINGRNVPGEKDKVEYRARFWSCLDGDVLQVWGGAVHTPYITVDVAAPTAAAQHLVSTYLEMHQKARRIRPSRLPTYLLIYLPLWHCHNYYLQNPNSQASPRVRYS